MTDLEITKLCAEAMEWTIFSLKNPQGEFLVEEDGIVLVGVKTPSGFQMYDPLHDDAQAMRMVERFHIFLNWDKNTGWWDALSDTPVGGQGQSRNLKRAICECVAKMQKEKSVVPHS